jgi:hypothetical protein
VEQEMGNLGHRQPLKMAAFENGDRLRCFKNAAAKTLVADCLGWAESAVEPDQHLSKSGTSGFSTLILPTTSPASVVT